MHASSHVIAYQLNYWPMIGLILIPGIGERVGEVGPGMDGGGGGHSSLKGYLTVPMCNNAIME